MSTPAAPVDDQPAVESPRTVAALLIPLVGGAAAGFAAGLYGKLHDPTGHAINIAGFSSPQAVKTWMATIAVTFGLVQVVTASGMWGRLGLADAAWTAPVHRWSGRLAIVIAIPVAVHCLYALGFESTTTRVLLHSVLGCFFLGAFVAKMLALPRSNLPGWALPVLGGLVSVSLASIWLTSALWFFQTFGVSN